MGDADEVWLVAGGEPGAARFGQLVQRLRKDQELSVEGLAERAALSVATIRAIEQGRRAPSEESGVRLLQVLLPDGALAKERGASLGAERAALDYSFTDPDAGARILLQFRARTAGDNRRWSSDKPRAGESKVEAFIREVLNDPKRSAAMVANLSPPLENLARRLSEAASRATHPAGDADFGKIIRRLATANEIRIGRIEVMLDVWDLMDSDKANAFERDLALQMNSLLDGYYKFPDDEVPPAPQ